MRHTLVHAVPALVLLTLLGCSESAEEVPVEDVIPRSDTLDPCGHRQASAALVDVSERSDIFHAEVFSRIEGKVQTHAAPVVHEVLMEAGGCRYMKLSFGTCDPGCAFDEVCTVDSVCLAEGSGLSAGTIEVEGLGESIEMTAASFSPGTYDTPRGLPADLFDEGDPIEVTLTGGEFPAAALVARGVAPMDTALTDTGYEMRDGQDAEVTWTPGTDPDACVQVIIKGKNDVHGAPLSDFIECEGPDSGSLKIPQALVEAFPKGETPDVTNGFDWPHSELTRYTRTSIDTAQGEAVLRVRSTTFFQISHPE